MPLFVLWIAPIYTQFFLRYYEIRLSDEGACEFQAALRSKHVRAQQMISVQRDDSGWRMDGDNAEHTALRFQGGSLVVVQPVDDFADFLTRLKTLNPAVDLTSDPAETRSDFGTAATAEPDARSDLGGPATEKPGPLRRFMQSGSSPCP